MGCCYLRIARYLYAQFSQEPTAESAWSTTPESSGTPRKPAVSGIIDSIHLVSITLCYFQILIAAPFPSPGDLMDLNFFHIKYLLQETLRICRDWEAMTLQCRCSITGSNDLSQGEEAALSPGGNRNSCSEPIGGEPWALGVYGRDKRSPECQGPDILPGQLDAPLQVASVGINWILTKPPSFALVWIL